jgi:predicted cobalt transporter CbtA
MDLTYGALIKRALVAGLVAGLLLALYTFFVVEPTIDRAVALEERTAESVPHGHGDDEEPLFSRDQQVGGGMAASMIYAAIVAAVFGTVLASIRHRLPHLSELGRVVWLAAVTFGAVALIPAIKYPANPPAVGDPDTVNERTVLYLVLIGLSVALAVGLVRLSGWLRHRMDDATRVLSVAAATAVGYGLLLVLMPGSPDAIDPVVPAQLVWDFRLRSIGGLALLWASIGFGLGWALDRRTATSTATVDHSVATA